MQLVDLLRGEAEGIVADAAAGVERARLGGYVRSGAEVTRGRLGELLELALAAIETRGIGPVLEHAKTIAAERYQAGFDLGEVQTAINVLEEAMWARVLARIAPASQAEALGLVSTVLGMTKDALGRAYVSLASERGAPSLDLRRLFEGTQGPEGS